MLEQFTSSRPLRLALYSGVCLRHDAISNSLRLKLDLVDRWRSAGVEVSARAFVHRTDADDERLATVKSVSDLVRDPAFLEADAHIFEFGIHYPLFDTVFLLSSATPTAAIYHNITPPELAGDPDTRSILEQSLVQRHNLSRVQLIAAVSEFSYRELVEMGFPADRLCRLPLPSARRPAVRDDAHTSSPVELLYVGRFVRAKGVIDLLHAVATLSGRAGLPAFRLTMAGNPVLSSPDVLTEINELQSSDLADIVRVVVAPDDLELAHLYARSDVFVIPSYHEGYCVPVVEALEAGCEIVAYDSSNLPFIVGDLGTLVPTGDIARLTEALAAVIGRLSRPVSEPAMEERRRRISAHLESYSEQAYETGFRDLVKRLVSGLPSEHHALEPVLP
jgi:glycosyltransferase involved in cell wall biosynthesis